MNYKDEYNQMTIWLEWHEKLQQYEVFVNWQKQQHLPASVLHQRPISRPPHPDTRYLKMTDHLTLRKVSFNDIIDMYGAANFPDILGDFLAHLKEPHLSGRALCRTGVNT